MTRWLNHRLPGPLLEAHAYLGPGHSRRGAGLTGGRGSGRAGPVEADLELRKASGSERSAHVIPACSVDRRHAGPTSCLPSKSSNSSSNLNNSPSNTHDNSPTLAHSGAKRRGNNTCHSSPAGLRGSPWDVPCELGTCKDLVTSPFIRSHSKVDRDLPQRPCHITNQKLIAPTRNNGLCWRRRLLPLLERPQAALTMPSLAAKVFLIVRK